MAERLADHDVASPSAAMSDLFDGRREDLGKLSGAIHHVEGQTGAVACVAGVPVALDLVSRPEVFASLLGPLSQGYALDALGAPETVARTAPAASLLHDVLGAVRVERPTSGDGAGLQPARPRLRGRGAGARR